LNDVETSTKHCPDIFIHTLARSPACKINDLRTHGQFNSTSGVHRKKQATFCRVIRRGMQNGVKSVFGGPHATFLPEMIVEEGVDAICRGEAEESFLHYLEYLDGRRAPDQIPGFLLRDGKDGVRNPIAALPGDLGG
jgi:radical SAM superfamily enzyme YgiQ (UPF0313 family)